MPNRTKSRIAQMAMATWLLAGTGLFCYRLLTVWIGG